MTPALNWDYIFKSRTIGLGWQGEIEVKMATSTPASAVSELHPDGPLPAIVCTHFSALKRPGFCSGLLLSGLEYG